MFFPLSHADAIKQHKYLNLKALCDTNNETLNKVANHFQVEYKFLDFNKMLKLSNPELITMWQEQILDHILFIGLMILE